MTIEEVYDLYADKVYRFFYIKCLNRQIAEDLTSQTFVALVEKRLDPSYFVADNKKFVYGVMRNVWLMYLRQKYQRAEHLVEEIDDFVCYVDLEVDDYEVRSIKQRAEIFIKCLPEKQRAVVTMRLLEELSVKNICELTGKDSNYIKTTYKRGFKNLKTLIASSELTATTSQEVA